LIEHVVTTIMHWHCATDAWSALHDLSPRGKEI